MTVCFACPVTSIKFPSSIACFLIYEKITPHSALPIVAKDYPKELVSMLSKQDLITCDYNRGD